MGYDFEMDRLLQIGKMLFTKQYYLKRISEDNKWIEATWEDVQNVKYNYPFPCANGLIIAIIEK